MTLCLPHQLMFGFWGAALTPWLIILSAAHKNNAALIAHEQCHQSQQRRDGTFTFWWRYLTNKSHRLAYEVEAYKVWIKVAPDDTYKVIHWLGTQYGLNITFDDAVELLTEPN